MQEENTTESKCYLTVINIPKMDCPSEERVVRMILENYPSVKKLSFDLSSRKLRVVHYGSDEALITRLEPLNYGASISESRELNEVEKVLELSVVDSSAEETKALKLLLGINAAMFVFEIGLGWLARSAGLISDSLDMFADASVYGLSLYAVGKTGLLKQRAAKFSGYLQLALALGALMEVIRRFLIGNEPEGMLMMSVATVALIANLGCIVLLAKHRKGEVHMRASWIFSTNDVMANLGVIIAGLLVKWTHSPLPDLVIGLLIAFVVFSGALRILRISNKVVH